MTVDDILRAVEAVGEAPVREMRLTRSTWERLKTFCGPPPSEEEAALGRLLGTPVRFDVSIPPGEIWCGPPIPRWYTGMDPEEWMRQYFAWRRECIVFVLPDEP